MFAATPTSTLARSGPLSRRRVPLSRRALGAGAALVLAATAIGAPAAHAATIPAPIAAMTKALASVKSYQIDLTITSAASAPIKATLVSVHAGTANQLYLKMNTTASGKKITIEVVVRGTKVCEKITGITPKFKCQNNPAAAAQFNLDPSQALKKAGTSVHFTASGSKMVNGQSCDGYTFTSTAAAAKGAGTLYLAHATSLPCEEDATATSSSSGKKVTVKTTAIWSHFNDASLKIPNV